MCIRDRFITGDGAGKPRGLLSHTIVDDAQHEWGSIGAIQGDFSGANAADGLIDLIYAPKSQFRANGRFVMNRRTVSEVRKLKESPQTASELSDFLGHAQRDDFEIDGDEVRWRGDDEDWGFRRFILHHAWLARAAGGVEAFLIGSEMRGVSRLRDEAGRFPFVEGLVTLCLLYTSPSPRDRTRSRMPSSA